MSDLSSRLNRLKQFYITKGSVREKDLQKEETYVKYCNAVSLGLAFPLGFQIYQIFLINKPDNVAKYNKIRQLKWASVMVATGLGLYHLFDLDKKWEYLDRFYPEKSEYQKNLAREAEMFVLRGKQEAKTSFTNSETDVYKKMYSLGTHKSVKPVKDRIPADFAPDDE